MNVFKQRMFLVELLEFVSCPADVPLSSGTSSIFPNMPYQTTASRQLDQVSFTAISQLIPNAK